MSGIGQRARRLGVVVALFLMVTVASGDRAVAALPPAPDALPQLWAVEVDGQTLRSLDRRLLRQVRGARVTLLASPRLRPRDRLRLAALSDTLPVPAIRPWGIRRAGLARMASAASSACRRVKRARHGSRCGLEGARHPCAGSPFETNRGRSGGSACAPRRIATVADRPTIEPGTRRDRLARPHSAERPGTRRGQPSRARHARRPRGTPGGRSPRPRAPPLPAVAGSASARRPVAAIRPAEAARGANRAADRLAGLAGRAGQRSSDRLRPLSSRRLPFGSARRSAVFGGLGCRSHVLEVDAVDRAGNRSPKQSLVAAPAGCGSSNPPPG